MTQATALARRHDVSIVGIMKDAPETFFALPPAVTLTHLVDVCGDAPRVLTGPGVTAEEAVV